MRLFLSTAGAAWFLLAAMMTLSLARAARRSVPQGFFPPEGGGPRAALPQRPQNEGVETLSSPADQLELLE